MDKENEYGNSLVSNDLQSRIERYADLTINVGLNLQPGQSVYLSAELGHAPFVRAITVKAYQAGAHYVRVNWLDTPTQAARLRHADAESLDYIPEFDIAASRQMTDEKWTRLAIVGPDFPDELSGIPSDRVRRAGVARSKAMRPYINAMMAGHFQWCLVAVPLNSGQRRSFPTKAKKTPSTRSGK